MRMEREAYPRKKGREREGKGELKEIMAAKAMRRSTVIVELSISVFAHWRTCCHHLLTSSMTMATWEENRERTGGFLLRRSYWRRAFFFFFFLYSIFCLQIRKRKIKFLVEHVELVRESGHAEHGANVQDVRHNSRRRPINRKLENHGQ
ncbi:hypothetical protein S245_046615 [Arachis hypogaea]